MILFVVLFLVVYRVVLFVVSEFDASREVGRGQMQHKSRCTRLNSWHNVQQQSSGTLLMHASRSGNQERAQQLLEAKADVDDSAPNGFTALHVACNPVMVDLLLEHGSLLEERAGGGWTPLMAAVRDGRTPVAKSLIDRGARVNLVNSQGNNALMLAAHVGATDLIALLLSNGGDAHGRNRDGYTAAMLAAKNAHSAGIALILEANPYIHRSPMTRMGSLFALAQASGDRDTLDVVISHGYTIQHGSIPTPTGSTPLVAASQCGNIDRARSLLRNSGDVSTPEDNGNTALHVATTAEMVELLLDHKFDVNFVAPMDLRPNLGSTDFPPQRQCTPLMTAASNGRIPVVVSLLQHGANMTAESSEGTSALMFATQNSQLAVMKLLLEKASLCTPHSANTPTSTLKKLLCKRDDTNCTSLFYAIEAGSTKAVELLLSYGADLNGPTFSDTSALSFAASMGELDVVRLLLTKDMQREQIDSADFNGETGIMLASRGGFHAVVSVLLFHNANAMLKNAYGHTALEQAIRTGHLETVNILVLHLLANEDTSIPFASPRLVNLALQIETRETLAVASLLIAYGIPVTYNSSWFGWTREKTAVDKGLELQTKALAWYKNKTRRERRNDLVNLMPNDLISLIEEYEEPVHIDMLRVWREWEQRVVETDVR
jgi:ankyrin repeat protein